MQVASILSDLNSLRVCDHSAALNLVNARTPSSQSQTHAQSSSASAPKPKLVSQESMAEDPDMQRATDLVELHYGVKVKHAQGTDAKLVQARREVERVLEGLRARDGG